MKVDEKLVSVEKLDELEQRAKAEDGVGVFASLALVAEVRRLQKELMLITEDDK